MSAHPDLRAPTGVRRGPDRFGESVKDAERDALRDQLQRFELAADPGDAEQQALLARMREHTRDVEFETGVWDRRGLPGVTREWNAPLKPGAPPPPAMVTEYEEWKVYEKCRSLLLAGLPLPPDLEPPAPKLLAPPPAAAVPQSPVRCGLLRKDGKPQSRASFLAALRAAAAIDWGDNLVDS